MTDTTPAKRTTPPSLVEQPKRPERMAVRYMLLVKVQNIPGDDAANRILCGADDGSHRKRWSADFIPSFRHFECTYHPVNQAEPAVRFYIHESHVDNWLPILL